MQNPWTILGVAPDATPDQIKAAYRQLVKDHHPDRGGDPERFMQIQQAYQQITDPKPNQNNSNFHNFGANFDFSFFEQAFDSVFSQHFGSQFKPRRAQNIQTVAQLTLEKLINGADLIVNFTHLGQQRTLNIKIPPGCQPGDVIKYAGVVESGQADLAAGDLLVRISLIPYLDYEYDHADLRCTRTITVWQAIAGCTLTVTDPIGKSLEIRVPAGCQPNTVLRITGHGGAHRQTLVRGDILVKIQVQIPTFDENKLKMLEQFVAEHLN